MTSPFDSIRHVENGQECWNGRELMGLLDYSQWRDFSSAIDRALVSCQTHGAHAGDHFGRVVTTPPRGGRAKEDYKLSRFGCYLVAMNSDPRKHSVANAQAYFCVKTREAELAQQQTLPAVRQVEAAPTKPLPAAAVATPEPVQRRRTVRNNPDSLFYSKECRNYPHIDFAYDAHLSDAEIVRAVDYNLRLCAYLAARAAVESQNDEIVYRARLLSHLLKDIIHGSMQDLSRHLPSSNR